jgi:uncharacterized protein (DUF1810 family)
MNELSRFRDAQDQRAAGFKVAMDELRAGRKRSHWIWYVFPQIAGLGSSDLSRHFGIRGRHEAEAYLRDEVLRGRLLEALDVVAGQLRRPDQPPLDEVMGSHVDALKLVSSLTLFQAVAADLVHRDDAGDEIAKVAERARAILETVATQGYERCDFTLQQLERP